MDQSPFAALGSYGLAGLVISALGSWVVFLYRELKEERKERLEDVKQSFSMIVTMQERNLSVGEKLSDVMTEIKDRDKERERELVRDQRRRP